MCFGQMKREEKLLRLVLQLFGTDCMRNGFFDGIWVSPVKQKILENSDTNWVITMYVFPMKCV